MPTIEEFDDPDEVALAPSPSVPVPSSSAAGAPFSQFRTVTAEHVKDWTILYPIYIDAKRPHAKGARRVPKTHAVEWPLAEQMNRACMLLGFESVYEPNKGHPKDWDNPGRVRVVLFSSPTDTATAGSKKVPAHKTIKTKLDLLKRIGFALRQMQRNSEGDAASDGSKEKRRPIETRLPAHSPAISLGVLDQASAGKGPFANMFPALTGGGADDAANGTEEGATGAAKQQPKVMKPKKVHIRRR